MTKIAVLLAFLSVNSVVSMAQDLTLRNCREAAVEYSPLTVRKGLTQDKREAKDRAVSSSLLPQLELNAQGSYQNEVVTFPSDVQMPISLDLPKDQYHATVELSQVIYGGNSVRNTKRVNTAEEQVEVASLDVQLDRLRDRINEIFIGILLADRQIEINALMQATLVADMKAINARIKHGTATQGTQATLEVRMLELRQQQVDHKGTRTKLSEALATLTGLPITETSVLAIPEIPSTEADPLQRSELKLYARQREHIDVQNRLLNSQSNPKLSLFASGGYGQPGYNMLDKKFAPMAIGGLRLNVPLTGWDATQKQKRTNKIVNQDIDQQQRGFEQDVSIETAQYATEIAKLQEVTAMDAQIVTARTAVRERAVSQFKNGVITDSEYMTEFNNEATARVNAQVNNLRLVKAWVDYNAVRGIY